MTVSIDSATPPSISILSTKNKNSNDLLKAVQRNDLDSLQNSFSEFEEEIINILINGESLLSAAIKTGSLPIIQYLIQNGARLDLPDLQELTPLDYATLSSNSSEILPFVISEWISRDQTLVSGYLNDPCLKKHGKESLRQLVIDTSLLNDSRIMNLIKAYAVNPQNEEILKTLFKSVNEPLDQHGNTLLHLLVQLSSHAPQVIHHLTNSLLKLGASPNVTNHYGQTPMHTACNNRSFLINTLSHYQADFFQKDLQGVPPVALISIESLKKDPLKLDSTEILLATFVVLNQITKSLSNRETSNQLIGGFASVPQLVNYSFILSQWALLIQKKGIISVLPSITTSILLHALLNGISLTEGKHLLPLLSAIPIGIMLTSAFKGLNTSLKNKNWRPLASLRNAVVHSINFSHALYESANMINNLANHVWHSYLGRFDELKSVDSELKNLENATNRVKEQLKEVNFLSEQNCVEGSLYYKTKLCAELSCIKDQELLLEEQFQSEILLNQQKIQKINEEILGKSFLNAVWDFVTNQKSVEQLHLETLKINPHSKEYQLNPEAVIKKQYHKLSLVSHPDKCTLDMKAACDVQFKKLNDAFTFFKQT